MYTLRFEKDQDSMSTENQPCHHWKLILGLAALALIGIRIVSISLCPSSITQQHLATANNIIRRYRCPPGGYPAGRKANGDCLCLKCPAGYFCPGGYSGKVACPRGSFQNILGQNACKKSPPGYHAPRSGASLPTPCPIGSFQPGEGHWTCVPSFPGNFVPRPRMINQVKCPIGKYQNQRGRSSCKPAPKGMYVDRVGQSRPTQCNYGSFNDLIGQTRCKPARPGRYVLRRGQILDVVCASNTYQHCFGQIRCIPCVEGQYSGRGSTKCSQAGPRTVAGDTTEKM